MQPVHWRIDVGATLARLAPQSAADDVAMLHALELPTDDSTSALARGCRLALDLGQHLFDTLYHAVALESTEATLITADERYFTAAERLGGIMRLADWRETARAPSLG